MKVVRHERKFVIRRLVAVTLGAITFGFLAGLLLNILAPLPDEPAQGVVDCMEDEPCWDCATMGNKVCGPITVTQMNGVSVLVDANGNVLGEITEP